MNIHEEVEDYSEGFFIYFKSKSDFLKNCEFGTKGFFVWLRNKISKEMKQSNTSGTGVNLS